MRRLLSHPLAVFGLFLVWSVTVGIGTFRALSYENEAGDPSAPPARWPKESRLARSPDLPTLTMFLHPRCPCSRASVAELAELLHRNRGRVRCSIVLFTPEGMDKAWGQTDVSRAAAKLPGVRLFTDREGEEARRFKVSTSGTAVLYDGAGRLQFHGGVTLSRGHGGDSPGRRSLHALLNAESSPSRRKAAALTAPRRETPVFGCPLSAGPGAAQNRRSP